jgi:PAS domain S-box-containing protein
VLKPEIYAALFANLTVGLAIVDLSGKIVQANPALQRMLGTPGSQLMGRPLDTIFETEERLAIHRLWNEIVSLQRPASEVPMRFRKESGGDVWGRLTLSLVSSGRKPAFAIAQLEDDTQRHGSEATANTRSRQLSILAHASRGFNPELSTTSILRTLVQWALELAGGDSGSYGILRAGGFEFTEYLEDGGWKEMDQNLPTQDNAVLGAEPAKPRLVNQEFDDPRRAWHEYFRAKSLIEIPILNCTGGILGSLRLNSKKEKIYGREDIELLEGLAASAAVAFESAQLHEKTRSELDFRDAALRASEERFYRAQETAKIGAFDWNPKSDRLAWWAEVPTLRGMVPDGLSETWGRFLHPDDAERVKKSIRHAVQEGRHFDVEGRVIRPDGETVWFRAVGHPIHNADAAPHYVGVTIDISSHKLAEEALLNSEKQASVGRMAATIAHEINNPLEAVLNLVYLARMSTPNHETKDFLISAEQEIARISHITKQTLAFYRDSTAPSQLDFSALVEETIPLYLRGLLKKDLSVQTRFERPAMLTGFGGELKQVISNLLANAIDVCGEKSSIWVRTRVCGDFVQLTVADRGSGIPQELRAHIFDAFFTTKKQVGTGLGLWVTRGIVKKHRGSIRVRSRTGANSGTVFMVRLPRNMPKPAMAG